MLIPALKPALCVLGTGGADALLAACPVALGLKPLDDRVFPLCVGVDGVVELAGTPIVV
jgi:hypothetical protein